MGVKQPVLAAVFAALLVPVPARAEVLLTPFIGLTFGGDLQENTTSYGASLAVVGGGVLGLEVDLGHSPNFFGDRVQVGEHTVTTAMANLVVTVPLPVRPHISGGLGLIRTRIGDLGIRDDDFGMNLGAGLIGFIARNVGLRADVRYFRNLRSDPEDPTQIHLGGFQNYRGTIGLTFRF
jgi:opacity protein-like surface antigen